MTDRAVRSALLFYPDNFFEMAAGTHRRVYEFVRYLKERQFCLDLMSLNGFTNMWDPAAFTKGKEFFNHIYVSDWPRGLPHRLQRFIRSAYRPLPDYVFPEMIHQVRETLDRSSFDFLIVNYVFWSRLAEIAGRAMTTVIDIHDCMTLQQHMHRGGRSFSLGRMFQDEIAAIDRFDYALSISEEETALFEPFCSHVRFVHAPIAFPERFLPEGKTKYHLLFVGSDNHFNKVGMRWFMDAVYPLLPEWISICIVGQVTRFVSRKPNVTLIPHSEDLEKVYRDSRIVICPLRSGTGLKVKVIEALSYGRPVVTTRWGLTGMTQKSMNGCVVADSEDDFARGVERLIEDEDHYRAMREQAGNFFASRFSPKVVWRGLDAVFGG